jgi:hypothetical protein
MRLIVLTVMGLMAGLGLAAAIVALPVMANKGPQRATLVAPLGGAQEQKVQAGGNPDGRGAPWSRCLQSSCVPRSKLAL